MNAFTGQSRPRGRPSPCNAFAAPARPRDSAPGGSRRGRAVVTGGGAPCRRDHGRGCAVHASAVEERMKANSPAGRLGLSKARLPGPRRFTLRSSAMFPTSPLPWGLSDPAVTDHAGRCWWTQRCGSATARGTGARPARSGGAPRADLPPGVEALDRAGTRYETRWRPAWCSARLPWAGRAYGVIVRNRSLRGTRMGRPFLHDGPRARVSGWPPLRLARRRRERVSVDVVSVPAVPHDRSPTGERDGPVHRHGRAPVHRSRAGAAGGLDDLIRGADDAADLHVVVQERDELRPGRAP